MKKLTMNNIHLKTIIIVMLIFLIGRVTYSYAETNSSNANLNHLINSINFQIELNKNTKKTFEIPTSSTYQFNTNSNYQLSKTVSRSNNNRSNNDMVHDGKAMLVGGVIATATGIVVAITGFFIKVLSQREGQEYHTPASLAGETLEPLGYTTIGIGSIFIISGAIVWGIGATR